MLRRPLLTLLLAAAALLAGASSVSFAQSPRSSSTAPASNQLDRLAANAKRDIAKYRATLPPVLAMFERELERQTELTAARQDYRYLDDQRLRLPGEVVEHVSGLRELLIPKN